MALTHTITRENDTRAEVGTIRFTMQDGELLPGVPSPAGTRCWECGEAIVAGEDYYMAAIWSSASSLSSTALIHAAHVDAS